MTGALAAFAVLVAPCLIGVRPSAAQPAAQPATQPLRAGSIDFPDARAPLTARLPQDGSDLRPDPAVRTGVLGNGLRYAVEPRQTPPGAVSLRLRLAVGAIHERDGEEGYAHLLEHMAFNGAGGLAEGELPRRLARLGAAFGPDLNASVTDTETVFRLDIPAADGAVREALDLLRAMTAGLVITPVALEREKAVVLAEIAEADTLARLAAHRAETAATPQDLAARRRAVGAAGPVTRATADSLGAFAATWYRPDRAVVVVVGDVDAGAAEALVRSVFETWQPSSRLRPQPPDNGSWPVASQTRAFVDLEPAAEPLVTVRFLHAEEADRGRLDTAARQAWWARTRTLERMLQARLDRAATAQPRRARTPSVLVTRAGNGWELRLSARPGPEGWQGALDLLGEELKAAVDLGFSADELLVAADAQRATLEAPALAPQAARSSARANQLVGELARVEVSTAPATRLSLFDQAAPGWTAPVMQQRLSGLARGVRPVIVLTGPVLRQGSAVPDAVPGAADVAGHWDSLWTAPLPAAVAGRPAWARPQLVLDDVGPAGLPAGVASRSEPRPHTVTRFANGVTLAHLESRHQPGRVSVRVTLASGTLAFAPDDQGLAALALASWRDGTVAGLAPSELALALAGSQARPGSLQQTHTRTRLEAETATRDLDRQLDVLLAQLTAAGLETDAARREALRVTQGWPVAQATPDGAMRLAGQSLFARGSPRFERPSVTRTAAADNGRLARGTAVLRAALAQAPVTVAIAGDVPADVAAAAVARTFGALPPRALWTEPPGSREAADWRPALGGTHRLAHAGAAGQALVHVSFPVPGDRDPATARAITLLAAVIQLRLTEQLRERDGLSYAPQAGFAAVSVAADMGRVWMEAEVRAEAVDRTRAVMEGIVADLRRRPPTADEIERARRPLIEARQRARQTNSFWASRLAETNLPRAPGDDGPGLMEADASFETDLRALGPAELRRLARRWLVPQRAVLVLVEPPAPQTPVAAGSAAPAPAGTLPAATGQPARPPARTRQEQPRS
jgi:zinc protease